MDAHKKNREYISALGDDELARSDLELAAAALRSPDGQLAWISYHRIGEVLRADALPELSAGFEARLAARLSAEPPLRRPATPTVGAPATPAASGGKVAAT